MTEARARDATVSSPWYVFIFFFIWTILMFLSRLRFGSPNSLQTIEPGSKWEEWRGKPTKKGPKRRWRVNVSCATSKFFFLVFLHFTYADNNFSNYYSSLGQVYDGSAITNNRCHTNNGCHGWATGSEGWRWGIPRKGFDKGDQRKEGRRDVDVRQRLFGHW